MGVCNCWKNAPKIPDCKLPSSQKTSIFFKQLSNWFQSMGQLQLIVCFQSIIKIKNKLYHYIVVSLYHHIILSLHHHNIMIYCKCVLFISKNKVTAFKIRSKAM